MVFRATQIYGDIVDVKQFIWKSLCIFQPISTKFYMNTHQIRLVQDSHVPEEECGWFTIYLWELLIWATFRNSPPRESQNQTQLRLAHLQLYKKCDWYTSDIRTCYATYLRLPDCQSDWDEPSSILWSKSALEQIPIVQYMSPKSQTCLFLQKSEDETASAVNMQ